MGVHGNKSAAGICSIPSGVQLPYRFHEAVQATDILLHFRNEIIDNAVKKKTIEYACLSIFSRGADIWDQGSQLTRL